MARLYWYGLAIIYVSCCGAGMIMGYTWGIGGSILGVLLGGMLASFVALVLNTPERMEAAFYTIVSVIAVIVLGRPLLDFGQKIATGSGKPAVILNNHGLRTLLAPQAHTDAKGACVP